MLDTWSSSTTGEQPTTTRRRMAFADAIFDGRTTLDGVEAIHVDELVVGIHNGACSLVRLPSAMRRSSRPHPTAVSLRETLAAHDVHTE